MKNNEKKPAADADDVDSPYAAPDHIVDWAKFLFGEGEKVMLPGTVCPSCRSNGVDIFSDRQWTCLDCGATGRLLIDVVEDAGAEASQPQPRERTAMKYANWIRRNCSFARAKAKEPEGIDKQVDKVEIETLLEVKSEEIGFDRLSQQQRDRLLSAIMEQLALAEGKAAPGPLPPPDTEPPLSQAEIAAWVGRNCKFARNHACTPAR